MPPSPFPASDTRRAQQHANDKQQFSETFPSKSWREAEGRSSGGRGICVWRTCTRRSGVERRVQRHCAPAQKHPLRAAVAGLFRCVSGHHRRAAAAQVCVSSRFELHTAPNKRIRFRFCKTQGGERHGGAFLAGVSEFLIAHLPRRVASAELASSRFRSESGMKASGGVACSPRNCAAPARAGAGTGASW